MKRAKSSTLHVLSNVDVANNIFTVCSRSAPHPEIRRWGKEEKRIIIHIVPPWYRAENRRQLCQFVSLLCDKQSVYVVDHGAEKVTENN